MYCEVIGGIGVFHGAQIVLPGHLGSWNIGSHFINSIHNNFFMSLAKNWCITWNNYSLEQYGEFKNFVSTYCRYGISQLEVGEAGTPHIQGYFQLKEKKRLSWLKANLSNQPHFEVAKGNADANKVYCRKEGGIEPYEYGIPISAGQRTDLEQFTDGIVAGESIIELIREQPTTYVKYARGLDQLVFKLAGKRNFKTRVLWFWGPTGTGKSREAAALFPDAYWKEGSSKWWDGFNGVDDVIIDDYRRDLCTFSQLLRLTDRYPCVVETKGGSVAFAPKTLVFTSPKPPRETWEGRTEEDISQLLRRIDEVREFKSDTAPPVFPLFSCNFNPAN